MARGCRIGVKRVINLSKDLLMESLREALRRFIDVVPHARMFEDTGPPWHRKMLESTDQITLAHIDLVLTSLSKWP